MKLGQLKQIIREEIQRLNEQRGRMAGPAGGSVSMARPSMSSPLSGSPSPGGANRPFLDWLCRTFEGDGMCWYMNPSDNPYGDRSDSPCGPCQNRPN